MGEGESDARRRVSRGMVLVASSSALILAVCCFVHGSPGGEGRSVRAGATELLAESKPLPSVWASKSSSKNVAAGAARMSQLAMVNAGPPPGLDEYHFNVPSGLSIGQHFVVNLPGRGSQIETVTQAMLPGQSVQLGYPKSLGLTPSDGSLVVEQSHPEHSLAISPSQPRMEKLPALPPLGGYPPVESEVNEWHNRPNPGEDTSARDLENWHPARAWARKRAMDADRGGRQQGIQARFEMPKNVGALKPPLASNDAHFHADAKQSSEVQLLKSKLATEKRQLMHTWRQGEKELGARQEAEQEAARLRKELLSSQGKVGKLQGAVASREADISLLKNELAQGDTNLARSLGNRDEKMEAEMRADSVEIEELKSKLAAKEAVLSKESNSAIELKRVRSELMDREKDMLRMENQEAFEAMQLQHAKTKVLRYTSADEHKVEKQAEALLDREQIEVKAEKLEVANLQEKLKRADEAKEPKSVLPGTAVLAKENARLAKEVDEKETAFKLEENKLKEAENKLQLVKEAAAATISSKMKQEETKLQSVQRAAAAKMDEDSQRLKAAEERIEKESQYSSQEKKDLKDLKAQAAEMKKSLSQVVLKTNQQALDKITQQASEIGQLRKQMKAKEEEDDRLKKSTAKQAEKMGKLKDEIDKVTRQLTDADERAADNPLLLKDKEEDDAKIHKLQEEHLKEVAKLQNLQVEEGKRAELLDKVKDLKMDLEHHRDNAIQKLKNELTSVEGKLQEAKEQTTENIKRQVEAVDAKKAKARVSAALKEESALRDTINAQKSKIEKLKSKNAKKLQDYQENVAIEQSQVSMIAKDLAKMKKQVQKLKDQNTQLVSAQEDAKGAQLQEKEKEATIRKHDLQLAKEYKAMEEENINLKAAEKAAESALSAADEKAKAATQEVNRETMTHEHFADDDSRLKQQVKADRKKIGHLEGELQIQQDEQKILQQQLVGAEAKIMVVRNNSAVYELKEQLRIDEKKIRTLTDELGKRNGDLAVEQSEVEEDKLSRSKGAVDQEQEVDKYREKMREAIANNERMGKKMEEERDEREVAEAKVVELQKMLQEDEKAETATKAKLWTSEAKVDRLRKRLSRT